MSQSQSSVSCTSVHRQSVSVGEWRTGSQQANEVTCHFVFISNQYAINSKQSEIIVVFGKQRRPNWTRRIKQTLTMANTFAVCLFAVFCCANLSFARDYPKECAKGPTYWCQSLRIAADCGSVGHCSSTVWETRDQKVTSNEVSDKFVHLFRELKDVKGFLNQDYLATRVKSACRDVPYPAIAKICKENTAGLEAYVHHVLVSETAPETMCAIVGMCNNLKLDNAISMDKKKEDPAKKVEPAKKNVGLLGRSKCTWGPAYWCSNISTSHECHAAPHCAARVWSQNTYPQDNDSICKICTDMVTQARDQLQSNETQEELKQVFEGSCMLIRIKIVRKECMKLADEFVPELVETLSSEMNPQTVCSVAGLCNNAKIDRMLELYNEQVQARAGCNGCSRTVDALRMKFDATSYEDFLIGLLQVCRKMDSLSDSCSMLVFKYYENILEATKKDLTSKSVCHVSGQCAYKFHQHDDFDFPEEVAVKEGDDVPCELCEQLVEHMRDTLTANTTQIEFYKVMQGLCKQTGKFKDECLHLAEQYYPIIYKFLTEELKPAEVCSMMGVCNPTTQQPISVLLPHELIVKGQQLLGQDERNTTEKVGRVSVSKQTNVRVIPPVTSNRDVAGVLPIERMFVSTPHDNKAVCSFCEYFLHYLQVELSDTKTIEKVKEAVDSACDKLPRSVNGECKQFVDEYGPSVIALLVEEIDPASVCPALGLCPKTEEVRRVSINAEKSSCPLCLFAVEQLRAMLKDDRSEESVRKALDNLCTHLSTKLRTNCIDFVDTYTAQLVEMLCADLDPQEICVYLKLCTDNVKDPLKLTSVNQIDKFFEKPHLRGDRNNFRKKSSLPKRGDIETNEIPDDTVNGRPARPHAPPPKTICVVCEFVMQELDEQIKDKHNTDEIMEKVHGICKHLPKTVRGECDQFVEKYGEMVISLLAQELEPAKICAELKLCPKNDITAVKEEILDCAVCETVVMAVKKVLANDKVDHDIVKVVEKSCGLLPAKYSARCHTMMEIYGDSVIHLIEQFGTKGVCQKIGLCSQSDAAYVRMYRDKRN